MLEVPLLWNPRTRELLLYFSIIFYCSSLLSLMLSSPFSLTEKWLTLSPRIFNSPSFLFPHLSWFFFPQIDFFKLSSGTSLQLSQIFLISTSSSSSQNFFFFLYFHSPPFLSWFSFFQESSTLLNLPLHLMACGIFPCHLSHVVASRKGHCF